MKIWFKLKIYSNLRFSCFFFWLTKHKNTKRLVVCWIFLEPQINFLILSLSYSMATMSHHQQWFYLNFYLYLSISLSHIL